MSTRAAVLSAVASLGVLAAGWQAGVAVSQTTATTATTSTSTSGTSSSGGTTGTSGTAETQTGSAASTTTTTQQAASGGALTNGTYTGDTASNQFGSVQVTVVVADGAITNVKAASTADDHHSEQINSRALPVLKAETLSAQGADISTVSGATYTSEAYLTSLQSALDQAAA